EVRRCFHTDEHVRVDPNRDIGELDEKKKEGRETQKSNEGCSEFTAQIASHIVVYASGAHRPVIFHEQHIGSVDLTLTRLCCTNVS
nr:hypothetical protein [Tanacetum cinerariifolium]